jgi:NTE family protein
VKVDIRNKSKKRFLRLLLKKLIILIILLSPLFNFLWAQDKIRTDFDKRPKVGLVLSGGGAKGYAHIGALKVIREAGLEFDYISGTSMGAIVGGLYAIGYSPEFIEKMVSSQDWNELLLDKIDRRNLTKDQKAFNEQQFISFPVSREKVSLPFGIKYGQKVTSLLSYLTSPVFKDSNFSNFQTPFLCIGTDIANGESVVLENGNLAKSMRASMAIPTVFTPVTINDRLLVDGGLVNNFPAKELAERGCDIIIGIDVQSHKDFEISDLSSITSILDRSAGFYREALFDTAMNYIDLYIGPDLKGYSVSSFQAYDSIILRGRKRHTPNLPN